MDKTVPRDQNIQRAMQTQTKLERDLDNIRVKDQNDARIIQETEFKCDQVY